jgi:hypothetical protein
LGVRVRQKNPTKCGGKNREGGGEVKKSFHK